MTIEKKTGIIIGTNNINFNYIIKDNINKKIYYTEFKIKHRPDIEYCHNDIVEFEVDGEKVLSIRKEQKKYFGALFCFRKDIFFN